MFRFALHARTRQVATRFYKERKKNELDIVDFCRDLTKKYDIEHQ